jgi:hypothetical protein
MDMNNENKTMLDWALWYAREKKWAVFPVREKPGIPYHNKNQELITPLEKTPYTAHGLDDATLDENQIRSYWTTWENALIGVNCEKSGLSVLDLDVKHEVNGLETYYQWGIDDTRYFISRTPSSGSHIIASGSIKSTTNVKTGVDTRGIGGYIIVPPSKILEGECPGEYQWVNDWSGSPAELPDSLIKKMFSNTTKKYEGKVYTSPDGTKHTLSNASLDFMKYGAMPGERNSNLFKAAADFAGCGFEQEETKKILSPICEQIGLSKSEVETVLEHAYSKPRTPSIPDGPPPIPEEYYITSQSEWDINSIFDGETPEEPSYLNEEPPEGNPEAQGETVEKDTKPIITPKPRYVIRGFDYIMEKASPPPFLVENLIMEKTINLFFGQSGAGKTYTTFHLATCIATGSDWLGRATVQRPVLIIDEDGGDWSCRSRLKEIALGMNEIEDKPIKYVSMAGFKLDAAKDVAEINRLIDETGAKVIIFDVLRNFFVGKENDSDVLSSVFYNLRLMVEKKGVTIIMLHHTDKAGDDYRGSSAIGGACDLTFKIEQDQDTTVLTFKTVKKRWIEGCTFKAIPELGYSLFEDGERTYKLTLTEGIDNQEGISAVLNYLETNGNATIKELEDAAPSYGLKPSTMKQSLYALQRQKRVEKTNKSRPFVYALKKENKETYNEVMNI